MTTVDARLLGALRDAVGGEHVLVDDELTSRYRVDWTRRFAAPSATVVRPGSTDEVAAVVHACRQAEVAIVPQGGNTGLVGGSVPLSGEVVVSTERLAGVEHVTADAGDLIARAGTTLAAVRDAAAAAGWLYGIDIASRGSATIGGTVATNAGGLHVVRYGDTRHQVLGVEVVAGTGDVLSTMGGTLRDNTGYHLPSLVTGSEGTLGIVTRVRLRLVPRPAARTVALIRFASARDAAVGAEAIRRHLPSVEAVELFFAEGLELVCRAFQLPPPFAETGGGYVLAELAGDDDATPALAAAVESLAGVVDVAAGEDAPTRERLWRYRELHTDAIATVGVPHKLDIAVPPGTLAEFVERVPRTVEQAAPGAQTWLFGHGGESTVHVNVTGPPDDDYGVDDAVLRLVASMGGSISAEHGIGRAKRHWVSLARDDAQLRILAQVKAAFDPDGIMNPSVLWPTP